MKNTEWLTELVAKKRLPQALVLVCKRDNPILQKLLKSLLCTELSSGRPCDLCNSCTTFVAKSNPDLFILGEDGSIKVDDVRKIKSDGYIRPVLADRKVFCLLEADHTTREAQNALLKIFEEPPSYLTILLQTERKDGLLATILSRATCYYLEEEGPRPLGDRKWEALLVAAEKGDLYKALTFAPTLSKNKEQFAEGLVQIQRLCYEVLAQKAGVEGERVLPISSQTAHKMYQKTAKYSESLETNASLPLLATAFLAEIIE